MSSKRQYFLDKLNNLQVTSTYFDPCVYVKLKWNWKMELKVWQCVIGNEDVWTVWLYVNMNNLYLLNFSHTVFCCTYWYMDTVYITLHIHATCRLDELIYTFNIKWDYGRSKYWNSENPAHINLSKKVYIYIYIYIYITKCCDKKYRVQNRTDRVLNA